MLWIAIAVLPAVGVLEMAQGLTETRHASIVDFSVKGAAVVAGILIGRMFARLWAPVRDGGRRRPRG